MFKKVLIANRGAIATRIERTLSKMGIQSVAVYTKADQDSLHVDQADEAVLIGEGPAAESYLNADLIIKTAIETGAEAIHPGYGFLSENSDFARACRKNGITFIGPEPEQMEVFALKHTARNMARKAGVPLLPGTDLITTLEDAVEQAAQIGYPVILKSTAGGGGIGMRICDDEAALRKSFKAVRHLASSNFKNDGVYLEKYIAKARHVEVQIFGNRFGEVTALGERDCSLQRRNQKVIEESPAPNLPQHVRAAMLVSAKKLAATVNYRSAGTVEFLYDPDTLSFFFLEVNTRLQVEHGVTEEVLGIDLVEWMVKEAADELKYLDTLFGKPKGHSIQARIYAEDCYHDFRPGAGRIDKAVFSEKARVETWLRDGLTVTTLYDPMLAKIIVHGKDRQEAIKKLKTALKASKCYGITTNLSYLHALMNKSEWQRGEVYTRLLNTFHPAEHAIEVLDGGVQTTVQDYPGRKGYWDVGVPPCGPMDPLSFRIGNHLLGNEENAAGFEMTLRGGSYVFRHDTWFCLTGADMQATLDGVPVPMYEPVLAEKGRVLKFGEAQKGMRTYLLIAGGLEMPEVLGSSSTFTLGGFGGHGGRALRPGDVLGIRETDNRLKEHWISARLPEMTNEWIIGVIPGPHCTEEFLAQEYLEQLVETPWEVHFNSSRTGVRLIGPAPKWSREDGGEAGLHPSNIHDTPYAVGALDLTGDMPILLGPDGPSLGGFVCPVTTATAELWKIGQLHPGDIVHFQLLTLEEAEALWKKQDQTLQAVPLPEKTSNLSADYPVLVRETENRDFSFIIRCCGDSNLLVEYGEMELDLSLRFQIHVLMQAIKESGDIPVLDLTPGIRSLQVHINPDKMNVKTAAQRIVEIDKNLPDIASIEVPSRIVNLPLSWNDPATQLATERYQKNVRPDAPWCPSNLEFIRRINGLQRIEEVKEIVFGANYLVLGLGDVYLGAPVATPTDPRHRLVTTKYNPARTWTPENAVGIGGAYMCVYGMEGPGGYQFVGRTVQMWNKLRTTDSFKPGKPWLLDFFDQIRFYPVEADELLQLREDFLRGRFHPKIEETTFHLGKYMAFLSKHQDSIQHFQQKQQAAFKKEMEMWKERGLDAFISEHHDTGQLAEEVFPEGVIPVRCTMPGSIWQVLVKSGQKIVKGETLLIEESMKMEFPQVAPCAGTIVSIKVEPGDEVYAGQVIVSILEKKEAEVPVQ